MLKNTVTFRTHLSQEEATARLAAATIKSWWNPYDPKTALFQGWVRTDGFRIFPLSALYSSFRPFIEGTITATDSGAELCAKAHPHWSVKSSFLFSLVMMSFSMFFSLLAALCGIIPFWGPLFLLAMLGFDIALAYYGYTVPERKAEQTLRALLEAE